MNLEKEIFEISLVDIMPNRFQPREIFDDEALRELSESIKAHGVIQPIIVRKVGDKYEIIAGERRYRASQLAGKTTIPALVRDIDDKEAAKIALLENLQRKDLSPIEEAKTYQTILKLDNITQDELARNLGKSQSAIANKLRLLYLDEEVQTALLNSQISERHARSLLNVDASKQKNLLHKVINERLTVKQLDDEVMKISGKMPETDIPDKAPITNESEISTMNAETQNLIPKINVEGTIANQTLDNNNNQNKTIMPNILTSSEPKEPIQVIPEEPQPEVNTVPSDQINKPISSSTVVEEPINNQVISQRPQNIFDSLRIDDNKPEKEDESTIIKPNYDNIYDLRFAINNFRQAVQNTEKFGFKVKTEEIDQPESYQIIINIDKNK